MFAKESLDCFQPSMVSITGKEPHMKSLLVTLALLALAARPAAAQEPLADFAAIMNALTEGKEVRAVLHYGHCRLLVDGKETAAPDAIGGMELTTFEYFAAGSIGNPKAFVTTSETVLISHPTRGYVYNYVKLKIYEDNAVDVVARYLNPSTFEVVMDEIFYGQISTGTENHGAYFFTDEVDAD